MTTTTLNAYYCAFCASAAKFANKFFAKTMKTFDSIGRARAAAQLAQLGYHKQAKALMLGKSVEEV